MAQTSNERLVVNIPRTVFENAANHAEHADITMTAYFRTGHGVLYYAAKHGLLTHDAMLHINGKSVPLPQLTGYPDFTKEPSDPKKLVLNLTPKLALQADELIGASQITTRTAYAIATLNFLSGIVDYHIAAGPSPDFVFSIGPPNLLITPDNPPFMLPNLIT